MKVQYRNTADDYRALVRHCDAPRQVVRFILRVLVCCAPGTLLLAALESWAAMWIGWGGIGLLWLLHLKSVVWPQFPAHERDVTMWLDADALRSESDGSHVRRHWSTIKPITTTRNHLFLFISAMVAYVIPRRAFVTGTELKAFADEAKRHHHQSVPPASRGRSAWPEADPPVAAIFSDPERREVRFENTVKQYEAAAFGDYGSPDAQQRPRILNRATTCCLVGVGMLAVRFVPDLRPLVFLQVMVDVAGFFTLAFLVVALLQPWDRYQWRRAFDPDLLAPVTLCIAPSGVASRSTLYEERCDWNSIDSVQEARDCLVVWQANPRQIRFIIPKKAFDSDDACQAFVAASEQFRSRAALASEQPPANAPAREETGNPYQPPWDQ
jgi:hypothetical protein